MNQLIILKAYATLALSVLLVSSCGGSKFSGKLQSDSASQSDDARPEAAKSQKFLLSTASQPIDLIMLIDNSSSMTDEIAQVDKNFLDFSKDIASRADVALTLVSKSGPGPLNINLPQALRDKGHHQIDVSVGSYNGLSMLASGFCPRETGPVSGTTIKICGQDFPRVDWSANVSAMSDLLRPTLRPAAKLVIVVVSDENSMAVDESNFLSLVKAKVPNFAPTLFGFITDGTKCSSGMVGKSYVGLAASTGGATYPICESDWKSNFAKLSAAVTSVASKVFALETAASEIISVKLDGKPLTSAQYKLTNNKIECSEGVLTPDNKELVVEYK